MNAVVIVTTVSGTASAFAGETLPQALSQFYASGIKPASIELFTKFTVDPVDSRIAQGLAEHGFAGLLS
jgi:hypothetical protein